MSVTIDLELKAGDAVKDINAITAALEALKGTQEDLDKIDFDDIDIGEITGDIGNLVSMVDDLEKNLNSLEDTIDKVDGSEIEVKHQFNKPSGSTNDGDSTGGDPPEGGDSGSDKFNRRKLASQIGEVSGFGDDVKVVGGYDPSKLNDIASDIELTAQDLTFPKNYDNERAFYPGEDGIDPKKFNLGGDALKGNFYDQEDPSEMDSDKLRKRASEAGFYPQNADRETLEANLRKQQFGTDEIIVDTPSHGKVSSTHARRILQGQYDTEMEGVPFGTSATKDVSSSGLIPENLRELNQKQREYLKNAGLHPEKVSQFKGFDYDKLGTDEQSRLVSASDMDNQFAFGPEGNRRKWDQFTEEQQEKLKEAASEQLEDLFGGEDDLTQGRHRKTWANLNQDIRDSVPETDADIGREPSDSDLSDVDQRSPKKKFWDSDLGKRLDNIEDLDDAMDGLNVGQKRFGQKLRKLKPSMSMINNAVASLLPIMIALGTQLLGVAAAMGAVAAAGAGIIGLGLLGHGESMEESFAGAKRQIKTLKQELFDTFQPTMQQFAPIQSRMFDAIPERMDGIAEAMEGLTVYEDTLFQLGDNLAGGMEEAINIIVENEAAISDLATTFGGLIGSGALDFFEWLIKSASQNKKFIISLGKDMMKLITVLYNLSMVIAQTVTAFSPWINILLIISNLLRSDLVITLMQLVGWLYALVKVSIVMHSLYSGFMALASGIKFVIGFMTTYTLSTWQAVAATAALVGLLTGGLAFLGGVAGLGAVGGKMPNGVGSSNGVGGGVGGGMGGGKTVHNDNRQFTIKNSGGGGNWASQKSMEDTVRRVGETEDAQKLPPTETHGG
jgi:hypothetical protein